MSVRLFKRLEFARASVQPHPFFLERMAYAQMSRVGNFTTGPMMCAEHAADEYAYWSALQKLDHGMRYFMRPYTFTAFGHNERDMSKSHLLVRAWLQHVNGANNVIATVERCNATEVSPYMTSLNHATLWAADFEEGRDATVLKQTLIRTDKPYKGWYDTIVELQ